MILWVSTVRFYISSRTGMEFSGLISNLIIKLLAADESPNVSIPRSRTVRKAVAATVSVALFNTSVIFQSNLIVMFFATCIFLFWLGKLFWPNYF